MSSLQQAYDSAMMKEMAYHAAWPPIINSVQVGVFGTMSNGVFQVLGNLTAHTGGQLVLEPVQVDNELRDVDFQTQNARVESYVFKGGVKTPGDIPDTPNVEAELDFSFSSSNSIYVMCTNMSAQAISANLADYFHDTVWPALNSEGRRWSTGQKIVYQTYTAANYVMMGSSQKNTSFSLSGAASMLFDFGKGSISGKMTISSQQSAELMLTGFAEPGIIGFEMMSFKSDGTPVIPSN